MEKTESSLQNSQKITKIVLNNSNRSVIHSFLCETLMDLIINNLPSIITRLRLFHFMGIKWKRRSLVIIERKLFIIKLINV